jgi:hypothetical protein
MRRLGFRFRRETGSSLVETSIAGGITLLLLGVAIPAFSSASDAGDQGAAQVRVASDTRHALLTIAREMENASVSAVDGSGAPRLIIEDGDDPEPMTYGHVVDGNSDMGGFLGVLGSDQNTSNNNADPNGGLIQGTCPTGGAGNSNEGASYGSGARGMTTNGRERSSSMIGTYGFGAASLRPRHSVIPKNSILTFQKVTGYTIDSSGAPVVTWSTDISYYVEDRRLVREQDGLKSVLCNSAVGFQAQLSDLGTVILTVVSQAKAHAKGRLVAEANQIEISPKN